MEALDQNEIAVLLTASRDGDEVARNQLMELMYPRLRQIAGHLMKSERAGHTLQPTALANEAFLRLLGGGAIQNVRDRTHFCRLGGRVMRQILVDWARSRQTAIRGGGVPKVPLHEVAPPDEPSPGVPATEEYADVLDLHRALERLEELDPLAAQVVDAKIFGGLKDKEVASEFDISFARMRREWEFAVAWLQKELQSPNRGE
jgi:RNA polymerase sigma factor (TIGR02999 family)